MNDDAAALKRVIARTDGPVIVAGYAYAGAVVATASDERVKALVYVAALAPDEGETVAQVFYKDETHPKAPQFAPDADGFIWMPDEGFPNAFAQNATDEQIALSRAVQRPIAVKSIQQPAPAPAWKSKPTWYLLAEEDRMINPKTQYFMAERMKATIRSFAVDHTPLLTAPAEDGNEPATHAFSGRPTMELNGSGIGGYGEVKDITRDSSSWASCALWRAPLATSSNRLQYEGARDRSQYERGSRQSTRRSPT